MIYEVYTLFVHTCPTAGTGAASVKPRHGHHDERESDLNSDVDANRQRLAQVHEALLDVRDRDAQALRVDAHGHVAARARQRGIGLELADGLAEDVRAARAGEVEQVMIDFQPHDTPFAARPDDELSIVLRIGARVTITPQSAVFTPEPTHGTPPMTNAIPRTVSLPAADLKPGEMYFLLRDSIIPRPIAWVSTRSTAGASNVAPFSFFNVCCPSPPVLGFSCGPRGDNHDDANRTLKDTERNIRDTGEFVINLAVRGASRIWNGFLFARKTIQPGISRRGSFLCW